MEAALQDHFTHQYFNRQLHARTVRRDAYEMKLCAVALSLGMLVSVGALYLLI
jgi:hypothetical protein